VIGRLVYRCQTLAEKKSLLTLDVESQPWMDKLNNDMQDA
jgi:hypothetical protein